MNTTKQEEKKYNINVNTFLEVLQETLVYANRIGWFDNDEMKELKHISEEMKQNGIKELVKRTTYDYDSTLKEVLETLTKRNIREANK
jgi:CO dehydrogenase/acetyl-CoA synthase gamma subunit (corrinoid Fe-S protein)